MIVTKRENATPFDWMLEWKILEVLESHQPHLVYAARSRICDVLPPSTVCTQSECEGLVPPRGLSAYAPSLVVSSSSSRDTLMTTHDYEEAESRSLLLHETIAQ